LLQSDTLIASNGIEALKRELILVEETSKFSVKKLKEHVAQLMVPFHTSESIHGSNYRP
jgi:hypothetical protein